MHSAAGDADAGLQHLLVRVHALERGQQRRMNVDQAARPLPHELPGQDPHEARQADELDPRRAQLGVNRHVEVHALLVSFVVDNLREMFTSWTTLSGHHCTRTYRKKNVLAKLEEVITQVIFARCTGLRTFLKSRCSYCRTRVSFLGRYPIQYKGNPPPPPNPEKKTLPPSLHFVLSGW